MGFLDKIEQSKLERLYRKESEGKAKLRLLALIKRKEGLSYEKIGNELKIPKVTVYDWINNVDKEGLERIHDQERPGRPSKLMVEQESMLKKEIKDSPREFGIKADVWTIKTFRFHIKKNHGVEYSNAHMYRLIQRLELSLIKPRPRDYRADKEEQKLWKKEFKKKPNIIVKKVMQ